MKLLITVVIAAPIWANAFIAQPAEAKCQVHIWPNKKIEFVNCTKNEIRGFEVRRQLELKRQRVGPGQGQRKFYYNKFGKKVYQK